MSPTPQHFWLVNATYLEEKRAVALHFCSRGTKRMARTPFFPSFHVSKKALNAKDLKTALAYDKKRFTLEEKPGCFKVTAATFYDLNSLADLLFNETGFRPVVLQPERQLLLERNWSYFEQFSFFSLEEFAKSEHFSFPNVKLPFFSELLHETVQQLASESPEAAQKIVADVAASSTLRLPIEAVQMDEFSKQEALLENIFWQAGLSTAKRAEKTKPLSSKRIKIDGLAEVDFGLLLPTLLTKPFYNLGPDSINCECCRPDSLNSKNVLPSSLVAVEMLQDAFYFESNSKSFANAFHGRNSCKERRLQRMQEFCLKTVPVGPFFRTQKANIPFLDAAKLQKTSKARIIGSVELQWFCLKRESQLSGSINLLNSQISMLEKHLGEMMAGAVKEHGVLSCNTLEKNSLFLLLQASLRTQVELLRSLPLQLCNEKSSFFTKRICSAIESVEAGVLESFGEFATEKESRVVASCNGKAYLRSDRPYSLIKQFSEKQKIRAEVTAATKKR